MQEKPRVGLVMMQADWFACGDNEELLKSIQADQQAITNRLERHFEISGPWVVHSTDSLARCQHALRDADIDLVVLAFQTRAEDTYLVSLLQSIGARPLVLWCYLPWGRVPRPVSYPELMRSSGPVGSFAALGTLRNLAVPFLFTYGAPEDPRLIEDLQVAGRAARVRQQLRGARFGLIPSRNDRMQCTFVDEFRLMADFGPTVQYISVSEYRRAADALPQRQVEQYLNRLCERYPVRGVSTGALNCASSAALGLARLAADHRLDVLAINDASPELHRTFGMRPALYPELPPDRADPDPRPVLYQPEGDLGAATANFILSRLTGSPTMFLEMWFWDEAKNQLIGGHAGLQNPALAVSGQVSICRDADFCRPEAGAESASEGAQFQFMARPGRVTVFQLRSTPKGWQAIAASGVCLEGQPWVEAYPHAILRIDAPLRHFLNRVAEVGATQHWIMAYGSVLHELEAFCQMEKIPLEILKY